MPIVIKTAGFDQFADPSGGVYIKALIMGDHGVGKTPSAASWPKPIIADCEKGVMSVASKGTPYAEIGSTEDMDALLQMLTIDARKPVASRKYLTLVVDTIDTYQRKMIMQRLRQEKKDSLSGWADWGWLDAKMQQLMEAMLNLPMNVVVNMHTKEISDEDGDNSRLVTKARLKGDIKDSIFQDFDLIGRMEQNYVLAKEGPKKGERVVQRQVRWHAEPRYPALRDRSNKLPRFTEVRFDDQDYFQIFDAITAGLDELPANKELETLVVESDGGVEPAPSDVEGGPVAEPRMPAKKTAAKKTAVKKAAAPAPSTPVVEEKAAEDKAAWMPDDKAIEEATPAAAKAGPEPDPWQPPAAGVDGKGTADEPVVMPQDISMGQESKVRTVCDHVHTFEGDCVRNVFGERCLTAEQVAASLGATEVVDEARSKAASKAVEEAASEPVKPAAKPPAPVVGAVKLCGDQPPTMAHLPAAAGCGKQLDSKTNATRAQIGMLKLKTYLCDDCHAAAS